MNSEIRASSALASKAAQSGPAELSIQNPLFSTGEADAFSRMLSQQVSARDDNRRPSQAEQAAKSPKPNDSRQDKRADSRQDSGKSLPERSEQVAESRPERPVSRKTQEHKQDDKADDAPPAVANAQANAPATEQTTPAQSERESEGAPQDEAQVTPGAQMTGSTPAEEASVLAEIAALQSDSETAENPDLATTTDSAIAGNENVPEGKTLTATESVDPDSTVLEVETDSATQDAVSPEANIELPDSKNTAATTQPHMSVMSASSTGETATTTEENPGETATAKSTINPSLASATKSTEALSNSIDNATDQNADPAAEGELANWELGHEPTTAEKNAEKNTEFARQMATAAERNGPLKEQLAALVQQFKGGQDSSTAKSETRKAEAATDIKAPAFGRALEQLSSARVDSGKPISTGVQTPVGQREWAGELGQRLVMMVSSKLKSAEIHLNPKDLGPVEVRIRMHEDKAHVVFTSQVPQTREALEQAVPRLREMFDQNGVALGNVDVQDHGARHSHQQEQASGGRNGTGGQDGGAADADSIVEKTVTRAVGLVDYYA